MNTVRSWGVGNLAQSTELFAKQQVKQHSVIHLKDIMIFMLKDHCKFQDLSLQQNMFYAGEPVRRPNWRRKWPFLGLWTILML